MFIGFNIMQEQLLSLIKKYNSKKFQFLFICIRISSLPLVYSHFIIILSFFS